MKLMFDLFITLNRMSWWPRHLRWRDQPKGTTMPSMYRSSSSQAAPTWRATVCRSPISQMVSLHRYALNTCILNVL